MYTYSQVGLNRERSIHSVQLQLHKAGLWSEGEGGNWRGIQLQTMVLLRGALSSLRTFWQWQWIFWVDSSSSSLSLSSVKRKKSEKQSGVELSSPGFAGPSLVGLSVYWTRQPRRHMHAPLQRLKEMKRENGKKKERLSLDRQRRKKERKDREFLDEKSWLSWAFVVV